MPVFLALEVLCEAVVFIIELTVFKLTLKEQSLINKYVGLSWQDYIYNQTCYCLVKLDSFLRLLCI